MLQKQQYFSYFYDILMINRQMWLNFVLFNYSRFSFHSKSKPPNYFSSKLQVFIVGRKQINGETRQFLAACWVFF